MTQWSLQPDGIHVQLQVPCAQGSHPIEVLVSYKGALKLLYTPCQQIGTFGKITKIQCKKTYDQLKEQFWARILPLAVFHDYLLEQPETPRDHLITAIYEAQTDEQFCQQPKALFPAKAWQAPLEELRQLAQQVPVEKWGTWAHMLLLRRCVEEPSHSLEWMYLLPAQTMRSLPRILVSVLYASVLGDWQATMHFLSLMQEHELEDVQEWAHRQEGKILLGLPLGAPVEEEADDSSTHLVDPQELVRWLEKAANRPDDLVDVLLPAFKVVEDLQLTEAIPALARIMEGTSYSDLRLATIQVLGRLQDLSAVLLLIGQLGSEDYQVRQKARLALCQFRSAEVVSQLISALRDSSVEKRQDIYLVLGALGGTEAVAALRKAVEEEEKTTRYFACLALGASAEPEVIEAICNTEQNDGVFRYFCKWLMDWLPYFRTGDRTQPNEDDNNHDHIAKRERRASLRRIPKPTGTVAIQQILLNLLYGRYNDILALRAMLSNPPRGEAGHDLAAPAFIEMLHDENPEILLKACDTLGLLAEPAAVSTLAKLLLKSAGTERNQGFEIDLAEEVASAAFHAIVSIRHPRVLSLLKSLEGKGNLSSEEYVYKAILAHGGSPSVDNILHHVRWNPQNPILYHLALRSIEDPEELQQLLLLSLTEFNFSTESEIISLFTDVCYQLSQKGVSAIPVLSWILDLEPTDPSAEDLVKSLQQPALFALGDIADSLVIPPLVHAAQSEMDEVSETAKFWLPLAQLDYLLSVVDDESAALTLTKIMQEGEDSLCYFAIGASRIRKCSSVAPVLCGLLTHSNVALRTAACEALGEIRSKEAVPGLMRAAQASDMEVRLAACEALGKIASRSAVTVLVDRMIHDESSQVRRTACWALKEIGDPSTLPALIEALKDSDPNVRSEACQALERLGDRSAVEALAEAARDDVRFVRIAACKALCKFVPDPISSLAFVKHLSGAERDEILSYMILEDARKIHSAG